MDAGQKTEHIFARGVENAGTFKEKDWYREKIVDMVRQIDDTWILQQIHSFTLNMTKESD